MERIQALAVQINRTVTAARTRGVHIIHAPSGGSRFYPELQARRYVAGSANKPVPQPQSKYFGHYHPRHPIESDCDSEYSRQDVHKAYMQHQAIDIYSDDAMIDDDRSGQQMYNVLIHRGKRNSAAPCATVSLMCGRYQAHRLYGRA